MRWRSTLIYGLSVLPLWAGTLRAESPATQPATQPAAPADPDDHLPVVDAKSIASVVKLSVENKMLRMTTDLPLSPEQTRVRIANFPGKTIAAVRPNDAAPQDKSLASISVRHEMPPLPNQTTIYTLTSISPDHVALFADSEDSATLRSVQYIQSPVMAANPDPEEKSIRLYITITDMVNNVKTVDLKLTADNVIDLRRRYPRETAEYFQPLLATLGQESVPFAVDRRTAWQVLSRHWSVDPKVDRQVQELVKQLDADEYATRQKASKDLEKLGESAVLSILNTDRRKLSPEQNSQLDAFLAPYRPLSDAEAKRLAADIPFLLDCLYSDPAIRETAIKQLHEVTGKPIALDTTATGDQWLAQVRQLRKELLPPPTTKPAAAQPATTEPGP
jgi:hypothetical protein